MLTLIGGGLRDNWQMSEKKIEFLKMSKWRAVDIRIEGRVLSKVGLRNLLWGADIFIQGVPMIKLMIVANVVMWALLWLCK